MIQPQQKKSPRGHTALLAWILRDGTDEGRGFSVSVGCDPSVADRAAVPAAVSAIEKDAESQYEQSCRDQAVRVQEEQSNA